MTNEVVATIPVGDTPHHINFTPDGQQAWVANAHGDSISVIDTAARRVTATIPVPAGPHHVVFTADGKYAFLDPRAGDTVSVIDTSANRVIATVPVGKGPHIIGILDLRKNRSVVSDP